MAKDFEFEKLDTSLIRGIYLTKTEQSAYMKRQTSTLRRSMLQLMHNKKQTLFQETATKAKIKPENNQESNESYTDDDQTP
jgi:hypothetical protein